MGDINRHIIVIWQMVGVLAASVAAFVFAEKQGIPAAYAVLLTILVAGWVLEHLHDSNYWYDRNLVIIANIERIFLREEDLKNVHPLFAAHRPPGSFLTHLQIQKRYTIAIVIGVALYYFFEDVYPGLDPNASVDPLKWVPLPALLWFIWRDKSLKAKYRSKYEDYLRISPGIAINQQIDYGTTHGRR